MIFHIFRCPHPVVAAVILLAGLATHADAQNLPAMPSAGATVPGPHMPVVGSDLPSAGLFALPEGLRITIGASALMLPKYEGSKSVLFSALPIFEFKPLMSAGGASAGSSLDVRNLDDLSFSLAKANGFEFGPLVGYRLGRSETDSPRLAGLGDIDGGIVAGAFAKYSFPARSGAGADARSARSGAGADARADTPGGLGFGPVFVRGSFHQSVTGTDTGYLMRLTLGTTYRVLPAVLVKASAIADYASDHYMAAYFGVTPTQSARSGLRAYDAGAGLKSIGIALGTEYALTENWTLLASAGYTRLVGDAAGSPIVETADRIEARLGASRSFDWRLR